MIFSSKEYSKLLVYLLFLSLLETYIYFEITITLFWRHVENFNISNANPSI